MLEMRPSCECCDKDLPNGAPDARICTFECTWCLECIEGHLGGRCPNCGGNHVERPTRPVGLLETYPVSTTRVHNPREGCPVAARPG
jgi:hypothetical protein